jgi:hypothetical protein
LHPGYSLAPQLEALARDLGTSTRITAHKSGLPVGVVALRFDRLPDLSVPECVQAAEAFGIEVDEIQQSTIAYFEPLIASKRLLRKNHVQSRAVLKYVLNPFPERLKVCPACIREGRQIRLAWQTAWAFVCLRHQVLLHDHCPSCQLPIGSQRRTTRTPEATNTCGNQLARGNQCKQKLAALPSVKLEATSDLIWAQHQLEAALQGRRTNLLQRPAQPALFLEALAQLIEIIWAVAPPDQFDFLPIGLSASWQKHLDVRAQNLQRFAEEDESTGGEEGGSKHRWGDAHLLATAIPTALQVTCLHSQVAVGQALTGMIQKTCDRQPEYSSWIFALLQRKRSSNELYWHHAVSETIAWMRPQYKLYS